MKNNTSFFRLFLFSILSIVGIYLFFCFTNQEKPKYNFIENLKSQNKVEKNYSIEKKLIDEAKKYCLKNKLNKNYFVLIDFKVHPGKKRFFIYDFKKDSIVNDFLVTHGSCDIFEENKDKWKTAKFSNKLDSHCSSLGKYKIGKRGSSSWGNGIKYSLYGLESTNSNAFKRVVVLHSWEVVPDEECYPQYIALSWGCPAVSIQAMNEIDEFITKNNQQNMLLWIIN